MLILKRAFWFSTSPMFGLMGYVALAESAKAHHPMGGAVPSDVLQGVVSGLAHPVIGVDHLMFLLVGGLLLSLLQRERRLAAAAVFAGLSLVGILISSGGLDLPRVELLTACSVALGGVVLANNSGRFGWFWLFYGLAGLVHGYAYGEAILGAEKTPLFGYLAGCAAVQFVMMMGTAAAWQRWGQGSLRYLRLAGWSAAAAGMLLMVFSI